jgi:hypothetical protein
LIRVVADENKRGAVADAGQSLITLGPKRNITDCQYLIQEQDIGLHGRRHREAEPYLHAGAVALHGRVDEIVDPREVDDFGKPCHRLLSSSVPGPAALT